MLCDRGGGGVGTGCCGDKLVKQLVYINEA